jgi:TorA maturation chaperone TorD
MSATPALEPEDRARAYCYALIGRLMYAAPDAALTESILQQSGFDEAVPLGQAWKGLQDACRGADLDELRLEYDDLFVGVGKAPVTLYTGAYATAHAPDRHLLALRNELDALGLARRTEAGETEDHVSALCDVMRWLIEHGRGLDAERRYFFQFIAPAAEPLCAAIRQQPGARFYQAVAAYMHAFYDVERTGFELVGTDD